MGKKHKREKGRLERQKKALNSALGAKVIRCGRCSAHVTIPPIDSWAICPCGNKVSR